MTRATKHLFALLVVSITTVASAAPAPVPLASEKPLKKPLVCDSEEVRIGASSKACDILARRLVGVEWTKAIMRDKGHETAVLLLDRPSGPLRCHIVMRSDVMPRCEPIATP